jgi:serine/threonine protein kinase
VKPQPFGRFLLLDKVASGGMAEVWRAKLTGESGFQRIVAIKKILPHVCEDQEFITMFTDEAKITVQLQHSNIGQVYEFDKIDGLYYIAMEYISGKDLKTIWSYQRSRKTKIPLDYCCYVVQKMAEGLDYAHRKKDNFGNDLGIVHRDVSPQNALISWDGEVKVIDFGIAKAAEKGGHTRAGTLKGKFAYMSPEQIRGLPLDGRADVFALGVCLYELVTGERGFQAESEFSLLEMVRNVEIKPPTMVNREIPQELERIIFKALAKDREHRYRWGSDLAEDLQRYLLNKGKPPRAQDLGKFLRENFTVDYDKERLRLESYKEIEWEGLRAAPAPEPAPAAPPEPPPASLSAVQAALAESGGMTHPSQSDTFASSSVAPEGSVAAAPGMSSGGGGGGYVIAGHREEIARPRIREAADLTAAGAEVPTASGNSGGGVLLKIAAGLFLVLALAGAVGAFLYLKKGSGTLTVTVSGPSEAQVLLDGESVGMATPSITLNVGEGTHNLIVQKPNSIYQAFHLAVTVKPDQVVNIAADMQQAPGRFNVTSKPLGAEIFLDGQYEEPLCERTPCQISAAGGMQHQLTARLKGYKDSNKVVQVAPSQTEDVAIDLKPEQVSVTIKSIPAGATVYLDGEKMGKTPYAFDFDPSEGRLPKVKLSKGRLSYSTTVTISETEPEQTFTYELEK